MKLGVEKKKHVKSNGPFERNFCVVTSSTFSQELFTHWDEEIAGEREIREKKRARKKGKKTLCICICLSRKALFPLRMKGNVTMLFQSIMCHLHLSGQRS